MYFVYILNSLKRKYIYVGLTNNPERRIKEHQAGKEKTTRFYKPFGVVKIEAYNTRQGAREREKYLKSGIGKEFIKNNLLNPGRVAEWYTRNT